MSLIVVDLDLQYTAVGQTRCKSTRKANDAVSTGVLNPAATTVMQRTKPEPEDSTKGYWEQCTGSMLTSIRTGFAKHAQRVSEPLLNLCVFVL